MLLKKKKAEYLAAFYNKSYFNILHYLNNVFAQRLVNFKHFLAQFRVCHLKDISKMPAALVTGDSMDGGLGPFCGLD